MEIELTKSDKAKLKRWTEKGKKTFMDIYAFALNDQRHVTHPDTKPIPQDQWKTIAWNFAWLAADAVDGK